MSVDNIRRLLVVADQRAPDPNAYVRVIAHALVEGLAQNEEFRKEAAVRNEESRERFTAHQKREEKHEDIVLDAIAGIQRGIMALQQRVAKLEEESADRELFTFDEGDLKGYPEPVREIPPPPKNEVGE